MKAKLCVYELAPEWCWTLEIALEDSVVNPRNVQNTVGSKFWPAYTCQEDAELAGRTMAKKLGLTITRMETEQ